MSEQPTSPAPPSFPRLYPLTAPPRTTVTRWTAVVVALGALGCGTEDEPPGPGTPWTVDAIVPVALFHGEGDTAQVFCSATLLSPTIAVTIEHCGRTAETLDGVHVRLGEEANDAPPAADVVGIVYSGSRDSGSVEGVALFQLMPRQPLAEAVVDWTRLRVTEPPLAPTIPAAPTTTASGFGFGCDLLDDPGCCDPAREAGCDASPYGDRHAEAIVPVATDASGLWTIPAEGSHLCQGDSGVSLRAVDGDGVAVSAVYGGSYLIEPVTFDGTRFEGWDRVCFAFRWSPGESGIDQVSVNEWSRLCDHRAALSEHVPELTIRCDPPACAAATVDPEADPERQAAADDVLGWIDGRRRCE